MVLYASHNKFFIEVVDVDEANLVRSDLFLTSPFHVSRGRDLSLMKKQEKRSSLVSTSPHLQPKIHEGSKPQ